MDKKDVESILTALKNVKVKTATALRQFLKDTDESNGAAAKEHLTARQRVDAFFDAGTFVEIGAFVKKRPNPIADNEDCFESVICGYGAVEGRLVYAFAQDFSRTKGALSEAHAKKICNLYKLACENGAPIVGIFDSAGALLSDGVNALAGYGKIMSAVSAASGLIPQIAIVPGLCAGTAAAVAAMFDAIVTVADKTSLYVNSPFVLGENGSAEYADKTGLAAVKAADESSALAYARLILSYLPDNNYCGTDTMETRDDANRASGVVPGDGTTAILSKIADNAKFLELYSAYAPEMTVALTALNGNAVGVIANNHQENGGKLTAAAARKAAKFLSLCDCFGLPVITLVDSEGLDVSLEAESSPYAAELAKLAYAYTSAETPIVTVVTGEAYGAVYTLMGSKSLGADLTFALDSAKIGVMSAERAVAFLANDKIGTADEHGEEMTREGLEAKWNETLGSAAEAAYAGEIDDIVAAEELRARLIAAVEMLSSKSKLVYDKRHANLPL